MANTYLTELAKALRKIEIPEFSTGASGYFSEPRTYLDGALFDGEKIRPEVREHILLTLFRFWKRQGYRNPEEWATVWLAGSGVSYQWAGDRGNGDLDVLMGVDWPLFYELNPNWSHTSIEQTTDHIDSELRHQLWPRTAHTNFGGKEFEVTYFLNQDASDIRNIHPYAAYDLSMNTWTVRPPEHTAYDEDPGTPTWQGYAHVDLSVAMSIRSQIETLLNQLPSGQGPRWLNSMTAISRQVSYATSLMTDIHGHRRDAFRPGGKGYWDYSNWRWQMAKKNGIVKVLGAIEAIHNEAVEATQTSLYGAVLATADELVVRAALAHVDGR